MCLTFVYKKVNIGGSKIAYPRCDYVWLKHSWFGIDRLPIVVHNTFFINLKILPIFWNQPKRIPQMY